MCLWDDVVRRFNYRKVTVSCCASCAAELLDDDLFCAACGIAVERPLSDLPRPSETAVDGGDVPVSDVLLEAVGLPPSDAELSVDELPVDVSVPAVSVNRPRFCGQCGTPVPDESNMFCVSCGQALASALPSQVDVADVAHAPISSSEQPRMSRANWVVVLVVLAAVIALVVGVLAARSGTDDDAQFSASNTQSFASDTHTFDVSIALRTYGTDCAAVILEAGVFTFSSIEARVSDGSGTLVGTAQPVLERMEGVTCVAAYEVTVPRADVYELRFNHLANFLETRTFDQLEVAEWDWATAG